MERTQGADEKKYPKGVVEGQDHTQGGADYRGEGVGAPGGHGRSRKSSLRFVVLLATNTVNTGERELGILPESVEKCRRGIRRAVEKEK